MQGRQWKSQPWTLSTCCFIIFNMFFINSVVVERWWNWCMRYYDLWLYKIKVGCVTIEAQIQKALDSFSLNNCPQDPVLKRWHCPKKRGFLNGSCEPPTPKKLKKMETAGLLRNSYKTSFRLPSPGMKLPGKDLELMKAELFCDSIGLQ